MAVFLSGHSRCALCHEVLEEGQEISAFSAIVPNRLDPLHLFNDAAFHKNCFKNHPMMSRIKRIDCRLRANFRNRACEVCNLSIDCPNDYFATGYLAEAGDLTPFNLLQFHVWCLRQWKGLASFERALDKAVGNRAFENEITVAYFKRELAKSKDNGSQR